MEMSVLLGNYWVLQDQSNFFISSVLNLQPLIVRDMQWYHSLVHVLCDISLMLRTAMSKLTEVLDVTK